MSKVSDPSITIKSNQNLNKALVLINIGTPKSPEVSDVRRYLREFLMDPLVINIPYLMRWILVNVIIIWIRAKKSAHAYKSIWTPEGSPLMVNSLRLRDVVRSLRPDVKVEVAMRYQEPSFKTCLENLKRQGVTDITAVPMFPQYSLAATKSAVDQFSRELKAQGAFANLQFIDESAPVFRRDFVLAQAAVLREKISDFKPDHVLMSYHGLPVNHLTALHPNVCRADQQCCLNLTKANEKCYRAQCYKTSFDLAHAVGLLSAQYTVTFQSRLGRAKWIEPYTDVELPRLAAQGVKRLLVVCPSFVADCLETVEEIGIRAKADWLHAGGTDFCFVPCVNDSRIFAEGLASSLNTSN